MIGNRGRVEIDARQAMARDASITGMTLFNVSPGELTAIHAAIGAGLSCGALNPIVGREMPLGERRARTRPCSSRARSARSCWLSLIRRACKARPTGPAHGRPGLQARR